MYPENILFPYILIEDLKLWQGGFTVVEPGDMNCQIRCQNLSNFLNLSRIPVYSLQHSKVGSNIECSKIPAQHLPTLFLQHSQWILLL